MAVKLVAVVGGLWLVYAVYRLAGPQAAAFSLFVPTVIINVPVLAQADSFWVAPCVLAVCAALRRDTLWTAIWAGVGFAFKAQAIFIAPFVLGTIMRAPLRHWLAPAGVYLAAMLPAWLAGWPAWDLAMVYIRQERWAPPGTSAFVSTAPNLWAVLRLDHEWAAAHFWIGFVLAGLATLFYLRWFKRFGVIAGAALSAAMIPFLLPGMHERFFALAEILTFCIACRTECFAVAALMQAALIIAIAAIELNSYLVPVLGAAIELWAIILLAKQAVRPAGDSLARPVVLGSAST
jgi:Gpi18-like mannosyltransferase